VFRDSFRSREIFLIVLPFDEVPAPNPANRLYCQQSPDHLLRIKVSSASDLIAGGKFLTPIPHQGVKIARRMTPDDRLEHLEGKRFVNGSVQLTGQ
jgi:hypothetical protein